MVVVYRAVIDRSYAAAAVSSTTRTSATTAAVAGAAIGGVSGSVMGSSVGGGGGVSSAGTALGIRPSKQHQLSRDLRRAASNAEQNLK